MKLKASMSVVIPLVIIFLVLCFLVAAFALQNAQTITLSYEIPFTSYEVLAEREIHVVYVILLSILIGIGIMIVFAIISGIGWQVYALNRWRRVRKERKWLWDKREDAIGWSLMGVHKEGIDQFESIIDKEKPHVELQIGLAQAFERKGDYQQAIENYNAVLAREPQNMRALFGAAADWEALGNYTEAIQLYERVLKLYDRSPAAIKKVQELLEKAGQYEKAIQQYKLSKASLDDLKTQQVLASLYYRLAVQKIKEGDLKSAEQILKDSRRESRYLQFYVPSMLVMANLYMKTGRERDARRIWETTAEATLSTIIFRRLEEYYYQQEGDPAENLEAVIELYTKHIEEDDANHLRLALGKLYMRLEKYDEAEEMLMAFQSKDSSIPQVHLLLADLYQRVGKVNQSLEEYRISAELVELKIADFKCSNCGALYEYWADQCTSCKSWGTIEDMFYTRGPQSVLPELKQKPVPQLPPKAEEAEQVVSAT